MKVEITKKYSDDESVFFFKNADKDLSPKDIIDYIEEEYLSSVSFKKLKACYFTLTYKGNWYINAQGEKVFDSTMDGGLMVNCTSILEEKNAVGMTKVLLLYLLRGIGRATIFVNNVEYRRPILSISFDLSYVESSGQKDIFLSLKRL